MRPYDPERVAKNVGRRIAELRRGRELTQEEFSVQLRTTFQWVSQLEAGRNITIYSLVKIANALKVPLGHLFIPPTRTSRVVRRGRPPKTA